MSLTEPSPKASPPAVRLPSWRFVLALGLGVMAWAAAGTGIYVLHSAPFAFVFYHLLCAIGGLLLRSPGLPVAHRMYPFDRRLLLGIVFAANLVTLLLYSWVGAEILDRPRVLQLLEARGLPPSTYLVLFPYFAVINPLAEEFFWRGGVYATLRHLFRNPLWPALIASALFGSWHWLVIRLFVPTPIAIAATVVIMGIGVALTVVYERTRRLAYPVILHALAGDAPLLLLLLLVGRG